MEELLPLASGFAIGLLLDLVQPRHRIPLALCLAALFAALATVTSGELWVSPWFLLIDLVLVAAAAAAGFLCARYLRRWHGA
jgi:hypothetical protein